MPYNPDDLMVQCEGCKDWYDTSIILFTIEVIACCGSTILIEICTFVTSLNHDLCVEYIIPPNDLVLKYI